MPKIEKQLKAIIKICDLVRPKFNNPEYLDEVKVECQAALENIKGYKEDVEFEADTEYYLEIAS